MSVGDRTLEEEALELAWSLWAELGVSSWSRSHVHWAVEVEPLIAYTAFLAERDHRLLRESVAWCVQNEDIVSMHQLRHVVTAQRWPFSGPVGRFGATVSERSRRTWPGSKDERPYAVEPSQKSELAELRTPSLVQLRARSIFGVSGRAEIVRVLITDPGPEWTVARMASRVPYTRRQVANDLESLRLGGLLRRTERYDSATYSLRAPEALVSLIGDRPSVNPRWAPVFRVLTALLEANETLSQTSVRMPASELARSLRDLQPALEESGLREPPVAVGRLDVDAVLAWAHDLLASLASADPSFLPPDAIGVNAAVRMQPDDLEARPQG